MWNELGNTSGRTLPSASFSLVKRRLFLGLTSAWGRVDPQAPTVSHHGCIDWVHLVVAPEWKFDFLYLFFIDFVANLQKLYLELGVSKWGEPNFVGFILKCNI